MNNKIVNNAEIIVNKFGERQVIVAIEEMAELTQALTKYMRIKDGGQPVRTDLKDVLENVREELADVQLMIIQMQLLFSVFDEDLALTMVKKLERTLQLMEVEENEN